MVYQCNLVTNAKKVVEKYNYQKDRRKSRAVLGAQLHNERKKRDMIEYECHDNSFKYKNLKITHTKARMKANVKAASSEYYNENSCLYDSDFYDENIYDILENDECSPCNQTEDKKDDFNSVINESVNELNNTRIHFNDINNSFIFSLFLIIDTLFKINSARKQYCAKISQKLIAPNRKKKTKVNENMEVDMNTTTNGTKRKHDSIDEKKDDVDSTKKSMPQRGPYGHNKNNRPKPRYKIRKGKNEEKFLINTVLFKLTREETQKWNDDENLTENVSKALGIDIQEARLNGQRMYVSPMNEEDHDKIIRQTAIPVYETKTLHNKSVHFILKELSFNDIQSSVKIQNDLKFMGVTKWAPLFEDDESEEAKRDERVRCKCKSRADLSSIMLKYFEHGKRFCTSDNYAVTTTFHPDIKNPTQCYKCFSFDGHMAKVCSKLVCGRCGEDDHDLDSCQSAKPCCSNCGGKHEARDFRCSMYQNERVKAEELECFHITGEVIKKMPHPMNKREMNAQVIAKFDYASRVRNGVTPMAPQQTKKYDKGNTEEKYDNLERFINEEHLRQKDWFVTNAKVTESSVNNMSESALKMSVLVDSIDAKVHKKVEIECNKVRNEYIKVTNEIKLNAADLVAKVKELEELQDSNVLAHDNAIVEIQKKVKFMESFLTAEFDGTVKTKVTGRASIFTISS